MLHLKHVALTAGHEYHQPTSGLAINVLVQVTETPWPHLQLLLYR